MTGGISPRRTATPLKAAEGLVYFSKPYGRSSRERRAVFAVCLLLLALPLRVAGQSQVFRGIQTTPPKAGSSAITATPQRIIWRPWRPGPSRVNAKNTTTPWAYIAGASAVLGGALVVNRIVEHKENAKDWGKRGQMTLATETKIGRSSLPSGRYMVQHYADPYMGNEMLFEGKNKTGIARSEGSQSRELTLITKCRIIAMDHKAKETMVTVVPDGERPRILSLQIKGEKIAHIITQD